MNGGRVVSIFIAVFALACSDPKPPEKASPWLMPGAGSTTAGAGAIGGSAATGGAGVAAPGMQPVAGSGGTGTATDASMAGRAASGGAGGGIGASGGEGGGGGAGGAAAAAGAPGPAIGPKDGDPNAPIVTAPDVPCRTESAVSGTSFGSSLNATIGDRELTIDYPCGKHEGAHMTVIVNLHGTLIGGANFLYQRAYFSAYRLIHSHNLIVVHPQSASRASFGAQWGNNDGGTDLPHLIEVMNWVYTTFAKFNIRSTWIGGHSWGAAYAEGGLGLPAFVCNEMFQDKFTGLIGMSRLGIPPCADRVSMIGTRGSEENIALLDQDKVAMAHGCDMPMKGPEMVGNNERFYFEGCDPGWIHEDYNMLGKGHIDSMDPEVVLKIVEQIKSTEL